MESNRVANAIHRNHLKFVVALQYDQTGVAQCLEPAVLRTVLAMADRIAPLLKAADDVALLKAKEGTAQAAHAQTKRAVQRLRSAVMAAYDTIPAELERLRRLQLGTNGAENVLILRAVVDCLKTIPGFVFPPGLAVPELEAIIQNHDAAFGDWNAAKLRATDAAGQLIRMRPEVKRLWAENGLAAWIKAHVRQEAQQQAWGLPPKRRNRRGEEEEVVSEVTVSTVQPSTTGNGIAVPKALDGKTAGAANVGLLTPPPGNTPPAVKNGVNGTNGHDIGAPI